MHCVIVRSWDFFSHTFDEEDLNDVLSELEKLDPKIRQRWKPDPKDKGEEWSVSEYDEQISNLMKVVKLPKGFEFVSLPNDVFGIIYHPIKIRIPKAVERYYPDGVHGGVRDMEELFT